jgi:selenocysteine lyase/cysteine desulfurase
MLLITPDAPSSVAADIPESQRQHHDLRSFTFDMSGLSHDAPSSDLSHLSAVYQSVAANIPESQHDLRSLQVSAYICFKEKIEPLLTC